MVMYYSSLGTGKCH